jgi:hypothetical protein
MRGIHLLLGLLMPAVTAGADAETQPVDEGGGQAVASRPATEGPQVVAYQRGIRIDFRQRQVEVEATVILRQGLIELFACSPGIREHEAIVRIEARPVHLFQALGLLGLTPGQPVAYDPEREAIIPARGDSLTVEVRYAAPSGTLTVPIEQWICRTGQSVPVEAQPWVFAGSTPAGDGLLTADLEGTVIAVVDFPSALIALPESHSDSNEALWLEPLTAAIPTVGTRCTLVIRPGSPRIELDALGRVRLNGRKVSRTELVRELGVVSGPSPQQVVYLRADPHCPSDEVAMLRSVLRALQFVAEPEGTDGATSRPTGAGGEASRWLRREAASPPVRPGSRPSAGDERQE